MSLNNCRVFDFLSVKKFVQVSMTRLKFIFELEKNGNLVILLEKIIEHASYSFKKAFNLP
jgi:hypothetical protein